MPRWACVPSKFFFNTDSEFREPYVSELARLLGKYGLELVSVHPFTSLMEGILLFSEYVRRTEDGFDQYRRYFATAAALGAKYLTLHGERKMPGMQDNRQRWSASWNDITACAARRRRKA